MADNSQAERPEPAPEEATPKDVEGAQTSIIDEIVGSQLNVPPDEVSDYITAIWQSKQKADLVRDNANLYFKCQDYRNQINQWQRKCMRLAQQAGKNPEEIKEMMGSAAAAGAQGGGTDVVQLIKALKEVLQPEQPQQQDDTRQMMKDLLPVLLLSNKMGGGGNEQPGTNMAELIRELKEVLQPQQPERETVQMDLGGQVVNVPVETALMMGQQQQGLTREELLEVLQAQQQQGPVDPQEVKRQVKEEFRQDKAFWEEYFRGGQGSDPEVEKEKIRQQTKQKEIETDAELKKEEQKMKRQEIEAQQQLVNAIMNPTGTIDRSTGQRKRTVDSAGANAAADFLD